MFSLTPMRMAGAGLALAAALLGGFMAMTTGATAAAGDPVVIRNLESIGAFELENLSGGTIELRNRVEVQKRKDGVWTAVAAAVYLGTCPTEDAKAPECVTLKAGEKLRPKAWNGFTCDEHCGPGCKGNAYLGPGEFRFVAQTCKGDRKFAGPSFKLGKFQSK